MFNTHCLSTVTIVTRMHHRFTPYVQCLFYSILRSIAVHIHSVFCVPCNVCEYVQQCADTAILSRWLQCCWDAVSLRYTCTDGSATVTWATRNHTHVCVKTYSVEVLYVILAKSRENIWLKCVKDKIHGRTKNKHLSTPRIRELWWHALSWRFGNGRD